MKRHESSCLKYFPACPCNTCRKDVSGGHWLCCYDRKHRRACEDTAGCPDYEPEKKDRLKRRQKK